VYSTKIDKSTVPETQFGQSDKRIGNIRTQLTIKQKRIKHDLTKDKKSQSHLGPILKIKQDVEDIKFDDVEHPPQYKTCDKRKRIT
jgi:hypothetical protein